MISLGLLPSPSYHRFSICVRVWRFNISKHVVQFYWLPGKPYDSKWQLATGRVFFRGIPVVIFPKCLHLAYFNFVSSRCLCSCQRAEWRRKWQQRLKSLNRMRTSRELAFGKVPDLIFHNLRCFTMACISASCIFVQVYVLRPVIIVHPIKHHHQTRQDSMQSRWRRLAFAEKTMMRSCFSTEWTEILFIACTENGEMHQWSTWYSDRTARWRASPIPA